MKRIILIGLVFLITGLSSCAVDYYGPGYYPHRYYYHNHGYHHHFHNHYRY